MDHKETFKALPFDFDYSNRLYCEWIRDDKKGFRFVFSGEGERQWLQVSFAYPLAYRRIDEGDFLRTLGVLPTDPAGCYYSVYEVFNSEFLRWYSEEAYGIPESWNVRHFIFLSADDCIEVLSVDPPLYTQIDPESYT